MVYQFDDNGFLGFFYNVVVAVLKLGLINIYAAGHFLWDGWAVSAFSHLAILTEAQ